MDTETSEVIERINARIDALEVALRVEIRGESTTVRGDLRGEMSSMRDDLSAEIHELRDSVEASRRSIQLLDENLSTKILESLAESKRHALVLHEDVRGDIRLLAEAIATNSTQRDPNQR